LEVWCFHEPTNEWAVNALPEYKWLKKRTAVKINFDMTYLSITVGLVFFSNKAAVPYYIHRRITEPLIVF